MSAFALTNDIASITKTSKSRLSLTPHNQYINTELSDDKLTKLYSMYCALILMQYDEDCKKKE